MTAPTADTQATQGDDAAILSHFAMNDAERFLGDILKDGPADEPTPATDDATPATGEAKDAPAPDAAADVPAEGAEPAPPDAAAAPTDPFAPLLEKAAPLAYKVAGAERTFDAVLTLPDGKGGFIPPDKIADVQRALSSAEANRESNRALYEQVQRVERFTYKPTEAEQPVAGLAAVHRMQEDLASVNTVAGMLFSYLTDPAKLVSLLGTDANGNIVPNPAAMQDLRERAIFEKTRAAFDVRAGRAQSETQWEQQAQESTVKTAAIPDAIDRVFTDADPEDRERAKAYFTQFADSLLFKATPEQAAQYGVQPGQLMVAVDKMAPWFAERAENRATRTKEAEARRKAEAENVARQAQKPTNAAPPNRPLPPRRTDGTFRTPKPGEQTRKMTQAEILRAIKRGEDLPPDGRVAVASD